MVVSHYAFQCPSEEKGCVVHWNSNSQQIIVRTHLYLVILGALLFFDYLKNALGRLHEQGIKVYTKPSYKAWAGARQLSEIHHLISPPSGPEERRSWCPSAVWRLDKAQIEFSNAKT